MADKEYMRQQLEWVAWRIKALDEIDAKLKKMRALAVLARDTDLSQVQLMEVNDRLHMLQKKVCELDEQSRVFWIHRQ